MQRNVVGLDAFGFVLRTVFASHDAHTARDYT